MPAPVLQQSAISTADSRRSIQDWKLNQKLVATVVSGDNGRKNLRINGNIYSPLQHLRVDPGKSLTLIVKSLSPYVELGVLDRALTAPRSERQPGIVLSQNIQQWPGDKIQSSEPSLVRLISLLTTPTAQPLPSATTALMPALLERIAAPLMLTDPATLKPSLLHGSLIFKEGTGIAGLSVLGNDIGLHLLKVMVSLAGSSASDPGRLLQSDGLALYQSVSRASPGFYLLMARELGDELLQRSTAQSLERETLESYERRWTFELPVNFQDRLSSVHIRLFEEKSKRKQRRAVPGWAAEFEFELPGCGDLKVELRIEQLAVSVVITCINVKAVSRIGDGRHLLHQKLEPFGLVLSSLQCSAISKQGSKTGKPSLKKPPTRRDNIPLHNFHMQENARELNPGEGIPEFLYCGMAALFGYLFDIEESIH